MILFAKHIIVAIAYCRAAHPFGYTVLMLHKHFKIL